MSAAADVSLEPYDFRTGTELSREALSHLRVQSDRMAVALSRIMPAYLDCAVDFSLESVTPLTFERYLGELSDETLMGLVKMSARVPDIWWQIDPGPAGAALGRMLGGPPIEIRRTATALEMAVMRRFFQELMDIWASSWQRLRRWNPTVAQVVVGGGQLQTVVHTTELVRVSMQGEVAGVSGDLSVLLPVAAAQRLAGDQTDDRPARDEPIHLHASRTAHAINVPVAIVLHRDRLSLAEALGLRVGDVLSLSKPLDDPLIVTVRGQSKFLAQAGVRGGRIAARIIGSPSAPTP